MRAPRVTAGAPGERPDRSCRVHATSLVSPTPSTRITPAPIPGPEASIPTRPTLIDALLHPDLREAPSREAERYRLLALFVWTTLAANALGGFWVWLHDDPWRGAISLGVAPILIGVGALVRLTRARAAARTAAFVFLVTTTVEILLLCLVDGGIFSFAPAWLPLLAVMGMGLLGRRLGLVYGGVLLLVVLALSQAETLGLLLRPLNSTASHRTMGAALTVATGLVLMGAWISERERHLRRLELLAAERDARAKEA